jgi:hypothetical protein
MSGAVAILLVILVACIVGAIIYLLNKLLPGGIFGAFISDEDTQIAVTGGSDDQDAQTYKIKQSEDNPGDFQLVPSDSVEIELPEEPDEPGEPEDLITVEPVAV